MQEYSKGNNLAIQMLLQLTSTDSFLGCESNFGTTHITKVTAQLHYVEAIMHNN